MKNSDIHDPDWVTHPGGVILELMCVQWVHATELDPYTLERFVLGEQELTEDIKALLVKKTGVSAEFWANYESRFREGLKAGKVWQK